MLPVALSDVIAVGEVPTAAEIDVLAKAGFRTIIDTQPDGEVERLMASADVRAIAEKAGLSFHYLPIRSRRPTEAEIGAFATDLARLPRPIYACCYSGARTAAVWALASAGQAEPRAIVEACAKAGYDISFLEAAIAERRLALMSPQAAGVQLAADANGQANGHAAVNGATNGHVNGNGAAANGAANGLSSYRNGAAVAAPRVPELMPIVLPRAASAGGFAVSG